MIAFSIGLIACTMAQSDSTGVVLSYDGFRKVLLQRTELSECEALKKNYQKRMSLLDMRIGFKDVQLTNYQSIVELQKKDINSLRKTIILKKTEIWAWRVGTVMVAVIAIVK